MLDPSGQILNRVAYVYPAQHVQDVDGGVGYVYPENPTATVQCSIQQREAELRTDELNRVTRAYFYHLLMTVDLGLMPRDKLVWIDTSGNARDLFVEAIRDEGGRGEVFTVRAVELR